MCMTFEQKVVLLERIGRDAQKKDHIYRSGRIRTYQRRSRVMQLHSGQGRRRED